MTNFSISSITSTRLRNWMTARTLIGDALSAGAGTFANTWADGPAKPTGSVPQEAAVELPNGKILIVPRAASVVRLFDPATNLVTDGPAHGMGTTAAYISGVLLPNGKVLLIPYLATNFQTYDPATNTITLGPAHGITLASAPVFGGAALGADDMVYIAPGSSPINMWRYDYLTNTLTAKATFTAGGAWNQPFQGVGLLPSGDILCSPFGQAALYTYRPSTNVLTAGPSLAGYNRGVLLPDGRWMLNCYNQSTAKIYDPASNLASTSSSLGTLTGTNFFTSVVLLADGRVAFIPRDHTAIVVLDPLTGTVTAGAAPTTPATADKFRGALAMSDGRVLCLPNGAANWGLWTPFTGGTLLSLAVRGSRFFNHA